MGSVLAGDAEGADAEAGGADGDEGPAYTTFTPQQDRVIISRVAALLEGLGEDQYLSTTSPSDIASIVYVARNLHTVVRMCVWDAWEPYSPGPQYCQP